MTFEARDSAAKVVPARFKPNLNSSLQAGSTKTTPRTSRTSRTFQRMESKRNMSCQTGGKCPAVYKVEPVVGVSDWSPKNDILGRRAFTAAFVQFSRELMEKSGPLEGSSPRSARPSEAVLKKSPSAPDLAGASVQGAEGGVGGRVPTRGSPRGGATRGAKESPRPPTGVSANLLLRPNYLQRQALSMDNPFYESFDYYTPPTMSRQHSRKSGGSRESFEMELGSSAGVSGSQASMAMDLHDCQVTLKIKDESANKRSEISRRHQLLRQKPVEDDRDDRFPVCACASRFLCTPFGEDCGGRTRSNINLKSPCHNCGRPFGSYSSQARGHIPKMTADFRSQSFSQTCSYIESKRCTFYDDHKIFYVEGHRRKGNLSSENIRTCCEDRGRCLRRHSPSASPHRSPRKGCRVRTKEGSECLVHRSKDSHSYCLVRSNAKRRKSTQKTDGSLSAEEQNPVAKGWKTQTTIRSLSFSPIRKSTSTSSSKNNSRRGSPSPQNSSSPVTVQEVEIQAEKKISIEEAKNLDGTLEIQEANKEMTPQEIFTEKKRK